MDRKIIFGIIAVVLVVFTLGFFRNAGSAVSIGDGDSQELSIVRLSLPDMYCQACTITARSQFRGVEGVASADVDYKTKIGIVLYDPLKTDAETIAAASTVYPAAIIEDAAK